MSLSEYAVASKSAQGGLKALKTYNKVGWFIYMPGKSPPDAHWAMGKGKVVDATVLKEFIEAAKTDKKRLFLGRLMQVTLDDQLKRVFAPKGKIPPPAKLLMDAVFFAGKSGVGQIFPRLPDLILYDPKTMVADEDDAAEDTDHEDGSDRVDPILAQLRTKIQSVYSKSQQSYDTLCEIESDATEAEEILLEAERLLLEIEELSEAKALLPKTETELQSILKVVEENFSILETFPLMMEPPTASPLSALKDAIRKKAKEGQSVYDAILETVGASSNLDAYADTLTTVDEIWSTLGHLTKAIDAKPEMELKKILKETTEMVATLSTLSIKMVDAQMETSTDEEAAPLSLQQKRQKVIAAFDAWQFANDDVDRQISMLVSVLKANSDSQIKEIGQLGLNALTGNFKIKLVAAGLDIRQTSEDKWSAIAASALQAVNGYETHIASEKRIDACDNNPFGLDISIRATLAPALNDLRKALSALVG